MSNDHAPTEQHAHDRAVTLRNRTKLDANRNLLHWYQELYRSQFGGFTAVERLRILEIGSGVSPLKRFYDHVLTSDIMTIDHVDYVFDCHAIDRFEPIAAESLDVITLTNVLHHLQDPIAFLNRAAVKLKPGGTVIATEPYFSTLSTLIYRHVHPEPADLSITEPVIADVDGPLSSANTALPWLIFHKHAGWRARLGVAFNVDDIKLQPFSSLSYWVTGGISRRVPIPHPLYRGLFRLDMILSRMFPNQLASYFTLTLTRK